MIDILRVIELVNIVAFVLFFGLLGAAVVRMAIRLVFFRLAGRRASVILRRDFALLSAFLAIIGSALTVRFFGWTTFLEQYPLARLAYICVSDIVALSALSYWVWAEFFVIGRPDKEAD